MSIKGKHSESTILYIVLLIAGFAAAVVTFIIVYSAFSSGKPAEKPAPAQTSATTTTPEEEVYAPEDDLAEEMKDEAQRLVLQNYDVLTLYYTRGLPHLDEPYGNSPEDGYYTVDSEEYKSLAQLEELVDSTYIDEQAETVKKNSLGYGPIYAERNNGKLGIIENFTEMPYDRSWDNPTFFITPESSMMCGITITLHERDSGEEVAVTGRMIKTPDGWRLQSVLF